MIHLCTQRNSSILLFKKTLRLDFRFRRWLQHISPLKKMVFPLGSLSSQEQGVTVWFSPGLGFAGVVSCASTILYNSPCVGSLYKCWRYRICTVSSYSLWPCSVYFGHKNVTLAWCYELFCFQAVIVPKFLHQILQVFPRIFVDILKVGVAGSWHACFDSANLMWPFLGMANISDLLDRLYRHPIILPEVSLVFDWYVF